jgi:ferredoxin, 2Fe-2S
MAGTNPYNAPVAFEKPKTEYKLTLFIEGEKHELMIRPASVPYGHNGLPGSILDICEGHDIPLEHTCGGVCACSTCHVIIKEGAKSLNEATEDEEDQLEEAPGLTLKSRLGCQCVPNGSCDVMIEVPNWNRNAVKETPH